MQCNLRTEEKGAPLRGVKPKINYDRFLIKRTLGKNAVEVDVFTDEGSSHGNLGGIEASPIPFHG